jgi:hypothetical protein
MNPHHSDATYPVITMNISSTAASSDISNVGVIPLILAAIGVALALTGSTLIITNFVFDLIGFR